MSELWIPTPGREAATVCGGRLLCCMCYVSVCGGAAFLGSVCTEGKEA